MAAAAPHGVKVKATRRTEVSNLNRSNSDPQGNTTTMASTSEAAQGSAANELSVDPSSLMSLGEQAMSSGELEVAIQHFGAALEKL